ncbi:homeodomain mating-type protein [Moniliophthora roreri MCA 2997]|uniref:Homeodomain mating-type protein n=2 Tax=Moniliophthora roreri TaxID=221103 RepID=V2WJP7_MONRO|nr:homeodomain transcription factor HD2.2 [Moniliophthora roreri]ESK81812.1 homeodomain mating-type protein [Moniliophthora roreri MCA 2997]
MGIPTLPDKVNTNHERLILESIRARASQLTIHLKAHHERRWLSTTSSLVSDDNIPPLEIVIPQSFYIELRRLNISPANQERLLTALHVLIDSYANEFRRNGSSLLSYVKHPAFRARLPGIIERIRTSYQRRFEQKTLPGLLQQLQRSIKQTESNDQRRFNKEYIPFLEKYFELDAYPSIRDQEVMAQKSGMTRRQIEVWFQNHRRVSRKNGQEPKKKRPSGASAPTDPKHFIIDNLSSALRQPSDIFQLAEQMVSAETLQDRLDFDPANKYQSLHRPHYQRDANAPNPFDTPPSHPPLAFKLSELPKESQFRHLTSRPLLPLPVWDRTPYVAPISFPQLGPPKNVKNGKKAPPTQEEIDAFIHEFEFLSTERGRNEEKIPDEYKRDYNVPCSLPAAATYAKTIIPPTGRHPALCWHPSQLARPAPAPAPSSSFDSPPTLKSKKKKAGLPNRKPKNSPRQSRASPARTMRSSQSRSPSPNASSRTPSLESSGGRSLHRHASSSSLSEVDTPLFTPVSLPVDGPTPAVEIPAIDLNSLGFGAGVDDDLGFNLPLGFTSSDPSCDPFADLFVSSASGNSSMMPTAGWEQNIMRLIGAHG